MYPLSKIVENLSSVEDGIVTKYSDRKLAAVPSFFDTDTKIKPSQY